MCTQIITNETKIEQFANMPDAYFLDWDNDNGMFLYAFLNNATEREIEEITKGGVEIAFTEILDSGFLCFKFGILEWGDATFEPRFYNNLKMPEFEDCKSGIKLTVILIDPAAEGLVKGIKMVGIGHEFSIKFATWCMEKIKANKQSYDRGQHQQMVMAVRKNFTSSELAKNSSMNWKTN